MKEKLATLFFVMMVFFLPLQAQLRGDGLKTAIIQYEYIMGENTMGLVQYSDNYGALVCFKYDYMGAPFATIVTNDSVFEISYGMQAYKASERPDENINFNALTPELIKKYDIKSPGTIEFLGRNCTIYTTAFKDSDIKQITVWIYQGLELRRLTEYANDQSTDLVATSIEENPDISPDTFKIPSGFMLYAE